MTFLDEVIKAKRLEVDELRKAPPQSRSTSPPAFRDALRAPGLSVIAEIKRRSPSKGFIAPDLDAANTARAYARGGAAAISCLTDRTFFGARTGDLEAACTSGRPVLRKDFIIDEVQIDESAALGASAILLIVRILEAPRLKALLDHATSLGLDALVEVHNEGEIESAVAAGALTIGVNNRDLGTLVVDPGLALRLRPLIPTGVLSVAESGVRTRADMEAIENAGFDAVLIGETLARSEDPAATLRDLLDRPRPRGATL